MTGTLLTARDTGANEKETLGLELLGATDRIGIVGVTAIDDDVALLEERLKLADEAVDGGTGLNKENDFARALELRDELLNGVSALDFSA